MRRPLCHCFFFFFNDTATTEIYTLSLHDALPISRRSRSTGARASSPPCCRKAVSASATCASSEADRKSTRLNSSHLVISYAVFCLKKKKQHDSDVFTADQTDCGYVIKDVQERY